MKYRTSLGTTAILITVFLTLLFGSAISFLIYRAVMSTEIVEMVIILCIGLFILTLYLLSFSYRPMFYILNSENIIVRRPAKDVIIPICEIKDAFLVRKESMTWTERIGGNGGLFGFYGNFKNSFGVMTWYTTRLNNYLMIETVANDRFVLTPDDKDMVKEIRKLIGK